MKHYWKRSKQWKTLVLATGIVISPLVLATSVIKIQDDSIKTNFLEKQQWNERQKISWNGEFNQALKANQDQEQIKISEQLKWTLPIINVNSRYLNELKLVINNQERLVDQIGYYEKIGSQPAMSPPSLTTQEQQFTNEWTNQDQIVQSLTINPVANQAPIQFQSHFPKQQILKSITIENHPTNGATIVVQGQNLPQAPSDFIVDAKLSDLIIDVPPNLDPDQPPPNPVQPPLFWNYQLSPDQARFSVNRQILNGSKVIIANNGHPDLWIDSNNLNPGGNFNYQNSGNPDVGFLDANLSGNLKWALDAKSKNLVWKQDFNLLTKLKWQLLINDRYSYHYQSQWKHNIKLDFDLPNLKERMQFLVNQISQNAKWDNEFFFGPSGFAKAIREFKDFQLPDNINLLFLSDQQKGQVLTWFYQDVIKQVFALDQKDQAHRRFNLIDDHSAAGLKIYQPQNYRTWVDVTFDATVLNFEWQDWDGTKQVVSSPIRTKFYLDANELMINDHINTIDGNDLKNSPLQFGDQFGNLDANLTSTNLIYDYLFTYQNRKQKQAILATTMTYEVFAKSLFTTNVVNFQNPQRMIYFSSVDQDNKVITSWSDLALGQGGLILKIGQDIKQFFLPKDRQNLQLSKKFTITNFKHQYDIYYPSAALKPSGANLVINDQDNFSVNSIDPKWLLENLILVNNQSLDPKTHQLVNPNQHQQFLLATNLDFASFTKILNPQLKIEERNLTNGTIKLSLTLSNFNQRPNVNKQQVVKATNGLTYQLYDWKTAGLNDPRQKQVFYFNLVGFQKNYDLAINQNPVLDGKILNLDRLDPYQHPEALVDHIIAFDHYQNHNDPWWNQKLLVTRLSKSEFKKQLKPIIKAISHSEWQGLAKFNLSFGGDLNQQNAALNHNHTYPSGTQFLPLKKLDNPFSIINLAATMKIKVPKTKLQVTKATSLITNISDLWNYLLTTNAFGYQTFDPNVNIFEINSLDQADFIASIKNNQVQIKNLTIDQADQISFEISFSANGGKIFINNQLQAGDQAKIKLTLSGFEAGQQAHLIIKSKQIAINDYFQALQADWQIIVEKLIKTGDLEIADLAPKDWWSVIDKNSLAIRRLDQFATAIRVSFDLTKPLVINKMAAAKQLVIVIDSLDPVANLVAKSTAIDLNQAVSWNVIDKQWLWKNLFWFADQSSSLIEPVFDNHLLTQGEFLKQVIVDYQISKQVDQVVVKVSLKRKQATQVNNDDLDYFKTTTLNLVNLQPPLNYWNDWKQQTITWTTVGALISVISIISWLISKRNRD